MTFDEYEAEARRTSTRAKGEELGAAWHMAVMALGLAGEAGEVADLLKKKMGHGHPLDLDKLTSELGDVLWYVTALAECAGLTLDEIARYNVAKLRKRYPNGFTHQASRERAE